MIRLQEALLRIWHTKRKSHAPHVVNGVVFEEEEEEDEEEEDEEEEAAVETSSWDHVGSSSDSSMLQVRDGSLNRISASSPLPAYSFRSYRSSVEYHVSHASSSSSEPRRRFYSMTSCVSADDSGIYNCNMARQQESPFRRQGASLWNSPSPYRQNDIWGAAESPFPDGAFPGLLPSAFPESPGMPSPSPYTWMQQRRNSYVCVGTVDGHASSIASLAISGKMLYSASQEAKGILVSRKPDYATDSRFGGKGASVRVIVVVEDKVYTAHTDNRIRVWHRYRQENYKGRISVVKHKMVTCLPTLADYLSNAVAPKKYVQVRRHHKRLWIDHVDVVSCLAMGHDGLLYSGSWDRTVKVWKLSTMRCAESFKAHDDAINAMVVGSDGFLYTASSDSKVKVWVRSAGRKRLHKHVGTLEGHLSAVNALLMGGDGGRLLYSAGSDKTVRVWERTTQTDQLLAPVATLGGHRQAVLCLAIAGQSLIFSGSADRTVRIWCRQSGVVHWCLRVVEAGHNGPVKSIAAQQTDDGFRVSTTLFSGGMDGTIRVWKVSYNGTEEEDNSTGLLFPVSNPATTTPSSFNHRRLMSALSEELQDSQTDSSTISTS